MTINVIDANAKVGEKLTLDAKIFDGKVNQALLHQAVVTFLANQRRGLASTKTRGQVRGGGKKPWRQKGTGRARVGSIRSPLWRGGGIIFGPKPKPYHKELPKKMKLAALRAALNAKLNDKEIIILDGLEAKSHKTKEFFKILRNLKLDGQKVKFIVREMEKNLKLSSRNIGGVGIEIASNLNAYQALDCKKLIFTKEAFREVVRRVKQ